QAYESAFAPGFTAEPSGASEIEIAASGYDVVGYQAPASTPATLTAGSNGVDLDADGDADLTIGGAATLELTGSIGDDTISARGASGTGRQLPAGVTFIVVPFPVRIGFTAGHDVLLGHDGPDALDLTTSASGDAEGFGGDDALWSGRTAGQYLLDGGG